MRRLANEIRTVHNIPGRCGTSTPRRICGISLRERSASTLINGDTIRYDSVYLTCSKKLTGSQLSPPHGTNKKLKDVPMMSQLQFSFQLNDHFDQSRILNQKVNDHSEFNIIFYIRFSHELCYEFLTTFVVIFCRIILRSSQETRTSHVQARKSKKTRISASCGSYRSCSARLLKCV